jgi:hypothetical protein
MLILFRELFKTLPGKFFGELIGAQYGAYIIHLLIVIGVQAVLQSVEWHPFTKFVSVTLVGAALSFGIAHLMNQNPVIKRII